jgi:hypothetical protein
MTTFMSFDSGSLAVKSPTSGICLDGEVARLWLACSASRPVVVDNAAIAELLIREAKTAEGHREEVLVFVGIDEVCSQNVSHREAFMVCASAGRILTRLPSPCRARPFYGAARRVRRRA